jgi:hypothetical protein
MAMLMSSRLGDGGGDDETKSSVETVRKLTVSHKRRAASAPVIDN